VAAKKTKDEVVGLRLATDFKAMLKKLGEKEGLELTAFIRHLLYTHPKIQKSEK
jgi:hypothetical protein